MEVDAPPWPWLKLVREASLNFQLTPFYSTETQDSASDVTSQLFPLFMFWVCLVSNFVTNHFHFPFVDSMQHHTPHNAHQRNQLHFYKNPLTLTLMSCPKRQTLTSFNLKRFWKKKKKSRWVAGGGEWPLADAQHHPLAKPKPPPSSFC